MIKTQLYYRKNIKIPPTYILIDNNGRVREYEGWHLLNLMLTGQYKEKEIFKLNSEFELLKLSKYDQKEIGTVANYQLKCDGLTSLLVQDTFVKLNALDKLRIDYAKGESVFHKIKLKQLLIIAIFVTIPVAWFINNMQGCGKNSIDDDIQYEINSNNFKPIIEIDTLEINTRDSVKVNEMLQKIKSNDFKLGPDNVPEIAIPILVNTEMTFRLKNTGLHKAQLVGYFCYDTICGTSILRSRIFDEKKVNFDNSKDFTYSEIDILPQEVEIIKIKRPLSWIVNDTFTIHLLLIYENEAGYFYDTYYWARYKYHGAIMGLKLDPNVIKVWTENNSFAYLEFIDANTSYKNYSKKEKIKTSRLLDRYMKLYHK
jgi:hypothetical protein